MLVGASLSNTLEIGLLYLGECRKRETLPVRVCTEEGLVTIDTKFIGRYALNQKEVALPS